MKKKLFLLLIAALSYSLNSLSQVTYIGRLGDNTGSGSNNLFGNSISTSSDAYVDIEVFASGTCTTAGGGQAAKARAVLRRTDYSADPSTAVASAPIYVDATYNGENGNNDKFYVNLKSAIGGVGGVYSVEIEATCNSGTYGDASTKTTWNYNSPTLSYEKNQADNNGLTQTNTFLGYFVVDNVGVYRSMVVFNGMYHDIRKFTPGNPSNPGNLNSVPASTSDVYNASIGYVASQKLTSSYGNSTPTPICYADMPNVVLPMGGEVNIWKKTGSDVTAAKMKYRVYKVGTAAPAFSEFALSAVDGCPGGYNASTGVITTFPTGGSCWSGQTQNTANGGIDNSITMQRWQIGQGIANILAPYEPFTAASVGNWKIEYYTEVTTSAGTITDDVQTTDFSIVAPITVNGSTPTCAPSPLPVNLTSFLVRLEDQKVQLDWETSSEMNNAYFEIERSADVKKFEKIGHVAGQINSETLVQYSFTDENPLAGTSYYRLRQVDLDGKFEFSKIRSVRNETTGTTNTITFGPNPTDEIISFKGIKKGSKIAVIDVYGNEKFATTQDNDSLEIQLDVEKYGRGLYLVKIFTDDNVEFRKFYVN